MYIRSLHIRGLKLVRNLELGFTRDDQPRMWTVLLGENGTCKTTILQAIAMAAVGSYRAGQLSDASSLHDLRPPDQKVDLQATFSFGSRNADLLRVRGWPEEAGQATLWSRIWLPPGRTVLQGECSAKAGDNVRFGIDQAGRGQDGSDSEAREAKVRAELEEAALVQVLGYGVRRSLPSPPDHRDLADKVKTRLEPLFDKGSIIGTGFDHLLDKKLQAQYVAMLEHVITRSPDLLPRVKGLELSARGGVRTREDLIFTHRARFRAGKEDIHIPTTWLSHGYQAAISWIADLIGQYYLEAGEAVEPADMEGLVLIDELDLHLHPTWQLGLVRALKDSFPKIQFIASTHSPLVLPGLEADEVVVLGFDDEGNVVAESPDARPDLMTATEIAAEYFGTENRFLTEVNRARQQYVYLATDPYRSQQEEKELQRLQKLLRESNVTPPVEPVSRESR